MNLFKRYLFPLLYVIVLVSAYGAKGYHSQQAHEDDSDTVEYVFGKKITDPFRTFERDEELLDHWIDKKNKQSKQVFSQMEGYETLRQEINRYATSSPIKSQLPVSNNGALYVYQLLPAQNVERIVLYENPLDTSATVVFSTEQLNKKDSTQYSIYGYAPSPDNQFLALQIYKNGDEWIEIYIYDIAAKKMTEVINASMSFFPDWRDNTSFFYTQLNETDDPEKLYDNIKVKLHKLGEDQRSDKIMLSQASAAILYQAGEAPSFQMLPDGKHVVCFVAGVSPYLEAYIAPLWPKDASADRVSWTKLLDVKDKASQIGFNKESMYHLSNDDSYDKAVLLQSKLDDPEKRKVVFSPTNGYIKDFKVTEAAVYVEQIEQGLSQLFEIKEDKIQQLTLPFQGNLDLQDPASTATSKDDCLIVGLTNWIHGFGIYYLDASSNTLIRTSLRPPGSYDFPDDLVVVQTEVTSYDGVKVPVSIVYRKGLRKDSSNPVILEAYGAYGESVEPYFAVEMLSWYRRGGIYAVAHVRGGGEKGLSWHSAGKKANKPNSWKDLLATASYLIEEGYTRPQKLGLLGSSAGGITIGRALTEEPSLFGAAVFQFPLVNTTRMPNAVLQEDEFGSPDDSVEFQYLYEMDTYLHVKKGQPYPPMFFLAARNDQRIPAWQPAKMAALVDQQRGNEEYTLFRLYQGGHTTASREEQTEMWTDMLTFFLTSL